MALNKEVLKQPFVFCYSLLYLTLLYYKAVTLPQSYCTGVCYTCSQHSIYFLLDSLASNFCRIEKDSQEEKFRLLLLKMIVTNKHGLTLRSRCYQEQFEASAFNKKNVVFGNIQGIQIISFSGYETITKYSFGKGIEVY